MVSLNITDFIKGNFPLGDFPSSVAVPAAWSTSSIPSTYVWPGTQHGDMVMEYAM